MWARFRQRCSIAVIGGVRTLVVAPPRVRENSGLLLLIATVVAMSPGSAAAEYTLEEIKRGYRESIAALSSTWTRCEFSNTHAVEIPEIGSADVEGQVVEWAVDGEKFLSTRKGTNTAFWPSYDGTTT